MKLSLNLLIVCLTIIISFTNQKANAQTYHATTNDGKKVTLYSNGTWKFVESNNNSTTEAQFSNINAFFIAFKKAVQSKDMREISRFVHFPLEHDEGVILKDDFISGNSYFGNADYFNLSTAFKNAKFLKKYGENDYGITGTSMKFSKHSDGFWKLDAAYGSPDFNR